MFFRMLWQSKREKTRSHHWNVAWKKAAVFLCCPDFCTTQRLLHFWYVYLRLDLPMGAEWMIRAPLQSNSALRKMLVRLDFCFVCWAFYSSRLFCCWTNSWAIDIVNIHWLYLHCFSLSNWLSKLCPTVPVFVLPSWQSGCISCFMWIGMWEDQQSRWWYRYDFSVSRISFDQNPWAHTQDLSTVDSLSNFPPGGTWTALRATGWCVHTCCFSVLLCILFIHMYTYMYSSWPPLYWTKKTFWYFPQTLWKTWIYLVWNLTIVVQRVTSNLGPK